MVWSIVVGVGVLMLGAAAAVAWTSSQFDGRIGSLRDAMVASQLQEASGVGTLPEIVRLYAIRAGGHEGGPSVFHALQSATLASARDQAPMSIKAEQWTGTRKQGLVWKARGSMLGLPVTVVDSYVTGSGMLSARVLGAFAVAGGSGPDFDKGELMRYLSELPIYPDAILNASGLSWRQVDDHTVDVSARSSGITATVKFLFDAGGDIVGIDADDRPMTVADHTVPTPWHGIYSRYKQFGSYRIPAYSEVGWMLPDGLFTYWHGEVVAYEALQ